MGRGPTGENVAVLLFAGVLTLATLPALHAKTPLPWDLKKLYETPAVYPAPELPGIREEGVTPVFIEGEPYRGKPTRIFAWYGIPKTDASKLPAMVLVHGGGGTAFAHWVRLWKERGYAAIAMDTTGSVPATHAGGRARHEFAGPNGWGGFDQIGEAVGDQWSYHAVAAVVRSHSFLRSLPEVDGSRVGITGVSWGGYLTSMTMGVDLRFACAVPVYGCGFYHIAGTWTETLKKAGANGEKWISLWDASHYLSNASLPTLWVNGTTDHFFHLPAWQLSYRAVQGEKTVSLKVGMGHSQDQGSLPEEIRRFTDSVFFKKDGLPKITGQGIQGDQAWIRFASPGVISEVEFNFTCNSGVWEKRAWQTKYLEVVPGKNEISTVIPPEASVYFFNLVTADNLLVSSEHVEKVPTPAAPRTGPKILLEESFEERATGREVRGVEGSDLKKGASILVSDQTAANGKKSLKFTDAPGLSKAYHPMRHFFFKGEESLTNGEVRLAFSIRPDKAQPANLTVEFRDNRAAAFKSGPKLEFLADGSLSIGGKEVAKFPFDAWTRVSVAFVLDGTGSKNFRLSLSGAVKPGLTLELPCTSPDFIQADWLGFITYNEGSAVVYLDDILLQNLKL